MIHHAAINSKIQKSTIFYMEQIAKWLLKTNDHIPSEGLHSSFDEVISFNIENNKPAVGEIYKNLNE